MRKVLIAPALALSLVACDVGLEPGFGRYDGRYIYDGSVDGTSRYRVSGTLWIDQRFSDELLITIDWRYLDGSFPLLEIRSDRPARTFVERDGFIRFEFEGEFRDGGRWVPFYLSHDGWIRGRTITGDWYLWTGLGPRDTEEWGRFTARRR
jgi:hypothetical protein